MHFILRLNVSCFYEIIFHFACKINFVSNSPGQSFETLPKFRQFLATHYQEKS